MDYANYVTDIDLAAAYERKGSRSGTHVRNQFYYELMRSGPHCVRGQNISAPDWVQKGIATAIPWGKPGPYKDRTEMPDDHIAAYGIAHGLSDDDVRSIMDLILVNLDVEIVRKD